MTSARTPGVQGHLIGTSERSKMYRTFFVTTEDIAEKTYTQKVMKWTESDGIDRFLEWYAPLIGAPAYDMAATFAAKRYGRFIAFVHWCVAKGYTLSAESAQLMAVDEGKPKGPDLYFKIFELEENGFFSTHERYDQLSLFYTEYAAPVVHRLSARANIPSKELWGQIYHAMPSYLDSAKAGETTNVQNKLDADWNFIIEQAEPAVFLEKSNPFCFSVKAIPDLTGTKEIYTKPACCLSFKGPKQRYCYRCPRMTDEEREERIQKHAALNQG